MIETVLKQKNASRGMRLTVKTLTALSVVILAVGLPQLVHLIAGASGGVTWLPMYLPVLLGGCLLGARWGLLTGLASPVVSFLLTSLAGTPMPAATRLPFMALELALMALLTGLFSGTVTKKPLTAFLAVPVALTGGRACFLLAVTLFQRVTPLTPATVAGQILAGLPGMLVQVVLVPLAVIGIARLMKREADRD